MSAKTTPIAILNANVNGSATAVTTFNFPEGGGLDTSVKRGYNEACYVFTCGTLTGSNPQLVFTVYEFFGNTYVAVGSTGTFTAAGQSAVIDSSGGQLSSGQISGGAPNLTNTLLRAINKGTNTQIRLVTASATTAFYDAYVVYYSG